MVSGSVVGTIRHAQTGIAFARCAVRALPSNTHGAWAQRLRGLRSANCTASAPARSIHSSASRLRRQCAGVARRAGGELLRAPRRAAWGYSPFKRALVMVKASRDWVRARVCVRGACWGSGAAAGAMRLHHWMRALAPLPPQSKPRRTAAPCIQQHGRSVKPQSALPKRGGHSHTRRPSLPRNQHTLPPCGRRERIQAAILVVYRCISRDCRRKVAWERPRGACWPASTPTHECVAPRCARPWPL